jgi:hypothetical protein
MQAQKSPIYLIAFSFLTSLVAIAKAVIYNLACMQQFSNAEETTMARFGIEIEHFSRFYLYIPLILINLWLFVVAKNYPSKRLSIVALSVAFFAGCLLGFPVWRWFV